MLHRARWRQGGVRYGTVRYGVVRLLNSEGLCELGMK